MSVSLPCENNTRTTAKRRLPSYIEDNARMYASYGSGAAKDFFQRMYYLLEEKVENVHTDNGSEFHKHFDNALIQIYLTKN